MDELTEIPSRCKHPIDESILTNVIVKGNIGEYIGQPPTNIAEAIFKCNVCKSTITKSSVFDEFGKVVEKLS